MKVLKKIWWMPLVIYMTIIPSFVSDRVYNEICREIKISIVDSSQYRFITNANILSMIQDEKIEFLGHELNTINLEGIENLLLSVRELECAEAYTTADGVLHVDANQRDPVMRVITVFGNNYYIDKYGYVIPHRQIYTPRMIVVSGNIEVPDSCIMGKSILEEDDNLLVRKTFSLVEYISADEFWKRQIEQIWINDKKEIELVPRVGDHIVKFGEVGNYKWKFNVLRTFYNQIMPQAGWDKYDEIDMRFNGQLVCRKK
ncbi:MAG TPA: hypothetical protein ENH59_04745 [Bacteroidetes bacterium]|nr:hypothetical protein [Bacteroidota bacterium]